MRVLVNDLVKVVKNTQSLSFNITNELLGFDARKAEFIDEQPKEFLIYKTLFNLYHDLCATECMLQDIYEHVKGFGITEKE